MEHTLENAVQLELSSTIALWAAVDLVRLGPWLLFTKTGEELYRWARISFRSNARVWQRLLGPDPHSESGRPNDALGSILVQHSSSKPGGTPMLIRGSCHCGNITFMLHWLPEPTVIPARTCSCSFCLKHGGVWTSCPTGSLEVAIRDPNQHSRYAFGTRTADFHVCANCGVVPLVTSEIEGKTFAVVSVNAMDAVAPALFDRSPVSFDAENTESRLARRARGWIPDVRFLGSEA